MPFTTSASRTVRRTWSTSNRRSRWTTSGGLDAELPHGSNAMGAVYRDNARFGEQVQRWVDTFGRDRVLVIIFDDFAADTPGQFRRVLEFLEVDPDYQPAAFAVSNASHKSRGGIVRTLFESRLARWGRRKALPTVMGENNAARLARRVRHSRLNRRPNPRPPMRPELVRELQDEFMDDVAHLGRLVDRDLTQEWFGVPPTRSPASKRRWSLREPRTHARSVPVVHRALGLGEDHDRRPCHPAAR